MISNRKYRMMKLNSWSVSHRPNSVNETPNGKVKVREYFAADLTLSRFIPTQEGPECRKIRDNSLWYPMPTI